MAWSWLREAVSDVSGNCRYGACRHGWRFAQAQSLTLTPQLMQSIRLLQLEPSRAQQLRRGRIAAQSAAGARGRRRSRLKRGGRSARSARPNSAPAEDTVDLFRAHPVGRLPSPMATIPKSRTSSPTSRRRSGSPDRRASGTSASGDDGEAPDIDQFVAARPTLSDHLAEQVSLIIRRPGRAADRAVPDRQPQRGRLSRRSSSKPSPSSSAHRSRPSKRCCMQLQGCDPVGVFARDVARVPRACSCARTTGSIR